MSGAIRELIENQEDDWLAPLGVRSRDAARPRPEPPCEIRTAFQRDRDRIIHTKSFRRLMHKTQVFIAPAGDHYRTRLTHTLEVTQIARTIGRALRLNEDLIEAIGMGHDLGHTPFGHAGETALGQFLPGFRHNEQSLRVVDFLEKDGQGLNLTNAVRDGILRHSKPDEAIHGAVSGQPGSLEGEVLKISDGIAYINHDLDDAMRAGIIGEAEIPAIAHDVLGTRHAKRIDTLVRDIIANSNVNQAPGSIAMWRELTAMHGSVGSPVAIGRRTANPARRACSSHSTSIEANSRPVRNRLSTGPASVNTPGGSILAKPRWTRCRSRPARSSIIAGIERAVRRSACTRRSISSNPTDATMPATTRS